MPPPVGPVRRVFNQQERALIDPFKPEYMNTTTPASRKTIAQVHIFPALFNYWAENGVDLNDEEIQVRSDVSTLFYNTDFY